jgi:hypothetical protein
LKTTYKIPDAAFAGVMFRAACMDAKETKDGKEALKKW